MQSLLAVVDLEKIRENARAVLKRAGRPLIAVVKDDAYGHGAEAVCGALHGIAAAFAVATVEEGARLRTCGVAEPVLVLTPPLCREEALRIGAYRLTATVSSLRALRFLRGTGAEAHLAVNTGMNRYGVRPERVRPLIALAAESGVSVTGVYSHLYAPDSSDALAEQTTRFDAACRAARESLPCAVCHLSATGGLLAGVRCDAVRVGLALYGYLPAGWEDSLCVKPALKLYATVAETRRRLGSGAGYGRAPQGARDLYTLRVGYGDGFFREGGLGAVGKLCMDAAVCCGTARAGRRKLIFSDAEAYAREHGTTAYEALVNVTRRAEIVYRN